jgi:hypothetical protein
MLLVLASAVILRSEPRGTHDHILLSQIRDSPNLKGQEQGGLVIPPGTGFPFRRLLRLVGLRWSIVFNVTPRRGPRRKQLLLFTAPLYGNGSYSVVTCVFVAAEICLPSRCLAMNVYSDFTIPAFVRHITIWRLKYIPGSNSTQGMVKHESWKLHRSIHLVPVVRSLDLRIFIYISVIRTVLYYSHAFDFLYSFVCGCVVCSLMFIKYYRLSGFCL